MNFSQVRSSKGWIVVLATVVGLALGGFSFISSARANHVYTVTCGIVAYKPAVFFKSCSEGGVAVGEIEWEYWKKEGAHGKGIYAINDCTPDCATGVLSKTPVIVDLTGGSPLDVVQDKPVLNQIVIKTPDEKFLPLSSSSTETWLLE